MMPREEEEGMLVTLLKNKLDASLQRNYILEKENEQLKQQVLIQNAQIASLKSQNADRRSGHWKKLQTSISSISSTQDKQMVHDEPLEETLGMKNSTSRPDLHDFSTTKERVPRVPKPPPKPSMPCSPKVSGKLSPLLPPPPPPPPLPSKFQGGSTNFVKRVPEVVELYRTLTKRDAKMDYRSNIPGTLVATNTKEMIGEIENRSTYLLAIKSDVETQGEFIEFLTNEVKNAIYREISDVEAFVKWLDEELSYLVDERAVLKHFTQWPERKADAMREAAFGYRDLKNLESQVSSFHDDPRQPTSVTLKQMQGLQDKLERSVHNVERTRESASKRYMEFQIPWKWMLDTGIIFQLKLGSMKLAKEYMKRVTMALQSEAISEEEDLMLQCVRFAFRVHQFVGGFDAESRHAFQELRQVSSHFYLQHHKQHGTLCQQS